MNTHKKKIRTRIKKCSIDKKNNLLKEILERTKAQAHICCYFEHI